MTQLALIEPDKGEVVVRTITIAKAAISKNVYDGWPSQWKAGHRDSWKTHLIRGFEEHQVPKGAIRVACSASLVFPTGQRRDFQNYMHPLWYYVADALVDYGAIPDDTPTYFSIGPNGGVEFSVDRRQHIAKDKRKRTVLGFAFQC